MTTTLTPSPPAAPVPPGRAPAVASARTTVWLITRREILARVRDKTFLISSAFLIVLVAASVVLPAVFLDDEPPRITVTVVGPQAATIAEQAAALGRQQPGDGAAPPGPAAGPGLLGAATPPAADITLREAADGQAARAQVAEGSSDAALVRGSDGRLVLVGDREVPPALETLVDQAAGSAALAGSLQRNGLAEGGLAQAVTAAADAVPRRQLLTPPQDPDGVSESVGIAFSVLFFITTIMFGMAIAQSVTEEKQSRIVEILVATVPVRAILAGKVLGNTVLALGQISVLGVIGLVGARIAGQSELVSLLVRNSGWFLVFFLLGFTMLASLWAACGALAGRQEDLQSTTLPAQALLFVPFFASVYVSSPGTWLTALSYVPFSAPLVMPRRLVAGDAAWWEALAAGGIVVLTTVLLVVVASRIYQNAVLRTGSKTSWRAGLRGASR